MGDRRGDLPKLVVGWHDEMIRSGSAVGLLSEVRKRRMVPPADHNSTRAVHSGPWCSRGPMKQLHEVVRGLSLSMHEAESDDAVTLDSEN